MEAVKKFTRKPDISELTLREKIGQTVAPQMKKIISADNIPDFMRKNPFGSFWSSGNAKLDFVNMAYEVNSETVDEEFSNAFRKLVREINSGLRIPVMPGLDAERGAKRVICTLTELTTATGLAATADENIIYEAGACVAREVAACGVKWIWGPVVDNAPPNVPVMLTRTFSTDPDKIIKYAKAEIKGIQSQSVAATAKHFPGVDSLDYRDAHITPVAIKDSYEVWYERQGRVFEACCKDALSVMVGHTAFPAVDSENNGALYIPATASEKIINGLLREKLGFRGVVVTDAVEMGGVCDYFDTTLEMYIAIYNAGVDIILGPRETDFIDIIEKAVLGGKLSESVIDAACARVLDMKEKLGMFDPNGDAASLEAERNAVKLTASFSKRISNRIISWVSNRGALFPLKQACVKKVALVYIGYSKTVKSFFKTVIEEFGIHGAQATLFYDTLDAGALRNIKAEYDVTLYFIHLAPHSPYGTAGFTEEKARMFNYITKIDKEKSIAISTDSPYVWFDWLPGADRFINLYGWDEEVLRTLVRGLYGECEFLGKNPVALDPLQR